MKKILCYGDSNTWGYDPRKTTPEVMARYEDTVRWTGRLEMELGKDYRVIEAGYCGRTTVFDDPLVSHCNGFSFLEPVFNASYPIDWCVIMLGTNDTKTHFHASAAVISRGMERMVHEFYRLCETIHSNSTKLLLMSPPYLTRAKRGNTVILVVTKNPKKRLVHWRSITEILQHEIIASLWTLRSMRSQAALTVCTWGKMGTRSSERQSLSLSYKKIVFSES